MVRNQALDLAILDVMLPDISGFTLCGEIRKEHHFPVLMLTAEGGGHGQDHRPHLGADDLHSQPFNPLELTARKGKGRNPVRRDMDLGREYLGGLCAPRGLLSDSRARRPSPVPERAPEWEQSLPVEHGRLEADVSDFQRQTRVEAGDEVLLLVEAVDNCLHRQRGADWSKIKLVVRDTMNEFIWNARRDAR